MERPKGHFLQREIGNGFPDGYPRHGLPRAQVAMTALQKAAPIADQILGVKASRRGLILYRRSQIPNTPWQRIVPFASCYVSELEDDESLYWMYAHEVAEETIGDLFGAPRWCRDGIAE